MVDTVFDSPLAETGIAVKFTTMRGILSSALGLICFVPVLAAPSPAVVVLGDSLSSAYGITAESGWVDLLVERLSREGYAYRVVNASITGDTTRGGLARLPALLAREQPDIVIIELGGNDGLRGIDTQVTAANLEDMIRLSREAGARVLLLGVKLPANYGPAFGMAFHQVYLDAAKTNRVALVPFFLDGVALDPSMMQADGIHPNARAQPILLDNVWAALEPLLQAGGKTSGEPISSIRILVGDAQSSTQALNW